MSAELANEDYDFTITKLSSPTPNKNGVKLTLQYSIKNKENAKKTLIKKIQWTISGCPVGIVSANGSGSIDPTGDKIKCGGELPIRKGDVGTCNGTYFFYFTFPCSCQFEITDAGQIKSKGE